jgi:hypothetical protein
MKIVIPFLVVCSFCTATAIQAQNEAVLNQAIKDLNARAKTDADKKLVLSAVSQQTQVPEKTLQSQMATTYLNYGELLVADSLAEGSGKTLSSIMALKQGKGWVALSTEVKINPNSVFDRLRTTGKVVQMSQAKAKQAENTKKPNNPDSVVPQYHAPTAPRMGHY